MDSETVRALRMVRRKHSTPVVLQMPHTPSCSRLGWSQRKWLSQSLGLAPGACAFERNSYAHFPSLAAWPRRHGDRLGHVRESYAAGKWGWRRRHDQSCSSLGTGPGSRPIWTTCESAPSEGERCRCTQETRYQRYQFGMEGLDYLFSC